MNKNPFFENIFKGIMNRVKSIFSNPHSQINLNWFKIKYYKHLPPGKTKTHILFDKKLYFTDSVQLVNGLEEIFVEELYRQQLPGAPYIIDCGANIGLSVIYMKRQYPAATIIAFEPDDTNFSLLSSNIASFGFKDVILRKEAVWIENTTLKFISEGTMTSKLTEGGEPSNVTTVQGTRLKDMLVKEVDFLKIDIEGAEYKVLTDIADQLHLVKNMFLEYHGTFNQNNELAALINIINSSGFKFYIKEAATLFKHPFTGVKRSAIEYDVQLNIFCFRK
jgi:FkbM family methyltransferase